MVGHMADGLPLHHQNREDCDDENGERGWEDAVEAEGDEEDGETGDELGHGEAGRVRDEVVGKYDYVPKDLGLEE